MKNRIFVLIISKDVISAMEAVRREARCFLFWG